MAIGRVNTGGGGSGGTLIVTAPVGVTVTATKDGKTYNRIANADGIAKFKGLASGTWALSISDAIHDPTTPVNVIITADYAVTLAFFAATINITYPEGATCKATHTDGTELTAPDTSGTWACVVPSAGTWTVTCTDGENTKSESVEITSEGQSESVTLSYQLVLFDGENGGDNTPVTGGWGSSATDGGDTSEITSTYLFAKNGGGVNIGNWYGGTSNVYTKKDVDVSNFSTCTFTVTQANNSPKFYVGGAVKTVSASGTYTLDISSVTGAVTVKMTVSRPVETWNGYGFKVTKIILT